MAGHALHYEVAVTAEEFKQRVIENIKLWIPSLQTEREHELVNGIIGDIEVMDTGEKTS